MARDLGPHLADFAEFLGLFDRDDLFQHRFIPARVQDEAKVWLKALGSPLRRSFAAPGPPFPHDIFVDASTEWGIGITSGDRWAAYKFRPGWQQESRQILWAEAVALEFGLLVAIEMGGAGHSILIHSDNQGVIGAFRFGRCRGRQANTVLKRIVNLERAHKFELRIKYVPTAINPADGPSRGECPPGPMLPTFNIPAPVQPFLDDVRGAQPSAQ
ncbi:hypothetical protein A4X06_0g9876 [Tilletia controversa]|uniref:Uncharacterized protein n=1 Tax=Tilletia controversa TaxID=13291 RepID=A0A8X7SRP7_9BASI|nr:hypothetical protein A4X06_0g9876 [Tilletia controversa]